jgi:hypothetical protein
VGTATVPWTPRRACRAVTGPEDAWEQRTRETGLPLFVCNRTGVDQTLSFAEAESTVVKDDKRLFTFCSPYSTVLLVDWDLHTQNLVG